MSDVGTMEHGLRLLRLDLAEKLPLGLGIRRRPGDILEELFQKLVVLRLHPAVQQPGIIIGILHKQMPHPLLVALAPQLRFPLQICRISVLLP